LLGDLRALIGNCPVDSAKPDLKPVSVSENGVLEPRLVWI